MGRQYRYMGHTTAVGVVDKSASLLRALQDGPCSLAGLVSRTGIPRATAHRLAGALATHGLLALADGSYSLGPWLAELARADALPARTAEVLDRLREQTGCSAQLYRCRGDVRVCVAASDVPEGLRDTVPVGAQLPMTAGSAAQALLSDATTIPTGAVFTTAMLAVVRRRGWAQTIAERAPGVASVSAPVRDTTGTIVAAVSVSGPVTLLGRSPGRAFGPTVVGAAVALSGHHAGSQHRQLSSPAPSSQVR